MNQWFKVDKLSLNTNKTNCMCFHNKPYQNYCKLKIHVLEVSRVQVTKFLGVLVDEKLSWSNRINAICKNVLKNISIFKHIIKIMTDTYPEGHVCYFIYCSDTT